MAVVPLWFPNKPPPAAGVAVLLAVLPKRPAPGVVVVVPLPAFPNRPPEPPEAGAEVLAPALLNRLPPDD